MDALRAARVKSGKPLLTLVSLLTMLSITCTFGGLLPGASGSGEITGPIIAMLPASSVDKQGQAVDPKFTFDPAASQMAVVVQVGNLSSPAPMTITWYQVTNQGDQKLFTDTVQVSALDRAYSIGKNPGILAESDYKIVAALNGQTQQIQVSVAGPTQDQTQSQSQPATTGTTPTAGGQPPVSGGSRAIPPPSTTSNGANNQVGPTGPAYSGDLCIGGGDDEGCGSPIVDSTANDLDVYVSNETAYPVNVIYNGLFDQTTAGTIPAHSSQTIPVDPCSFLNPSDLPGTNIQVLALDGHSHSAITDFTLGRDSSRPSAIVQSVPPSGSRVKPGEKIAVKVDADDNTRKGTSWQKGLKSIEVTGPGGYIAPPWNNPDGGPKACDDHRTHHYEATYQVPKPPPPDPIVLCVIVTDFAGNIRKECGNFYTGDHWTGTMHTETHESVDDPLHGNPSKSGTWESALDLSVDGQGKITGSGEAKLTSGCEPWPWQTLVQATGIKFDVTGTASKDRLELHLNFVGLEGGTVNCGFGEGFFRGTPIIVPLTSPTTASGQASESTTLATVNHFSSEGTIELKCDNCAPGVGLEIPGGQSASMVSVQEIGDR